ncbi:MAG TPA: hypothetical protein GX701_02650 [Clostridiales bacterium]|nr:hypothetical protein [Clostridiales bacterium]
MNRYKGRETAQMVEFISRFNQKFESRFGDYSRFGDNSARYDRGFDAGYDNNWNGDWDQYDSARDDREKRGRDARHDDYDGGRNRPDYDGDYQNYGGFDNDGYDWENQNFGGRHDECNRHDHRCRDWHDCGRGWGDHGRHPQCHCQCHGQCHGCHHHCCCNDHHNDGRFFAE